MLLLTQLTYTRLQRGELWMSEKWKTPLELHPSISDSSCNSNICSHFHQECFLDNKNSLHIHMSPLPPLGPHLEQLLGLSHLIVVGAQSTELVSLYIGYWTLNNYYYYYYLLHLKRLATRDRSLCTPLHRL